MKLKTKEFQVLEDLWYARLLQSGFKDIEDKTTLKWFSSSQAKQSYTNNGELGLSARQDYFRAAGFFLHDHKFVNDKERWIWEFHAEGKSMREIVKALKTRGTIIALTQVKEAIHRLRALMFKHYNEKEND